MIKKNIINKISRLNNFLENYNELLSEEEINTFNKYYYLYEYTDSISVLEDNPLYPCLINYVKTGILTEEEMIEALLK